MTLSCFCTPFCVVKRKEKKRNINNNLAILPSHDTHLLWDQFKAGLCDDVKHKLHHMNYYQADQEILEDNVYNYGFWDLNRIFVIVVL